MEPSETIRIGVTSAKERKKRQREMYLAVGCFLLVLILSWVELNVIEFDSYLFFSLFNLNFILLLLVLFIVLRNGVKLILERRRKVLGSRLRTRLVLAFMSLSLAPTLLMFLLSVRFVQTSVDYWFRGQVENSLEQALDVGQAYYDASREHLRDQALGLELLLEDKGGKKDKILPLGLANRLGAGRERYGLALVALLDKDRKLLDQAATPGFSWKDLDGRLPPEAFQPPDQEGDFFSTLWPESESRLMVGVLSLDQGQWLVLGEPLGQGLMFKLDSIVRGVEEFKKLKTLKNPLKMALYFIMATITLLIIFGAMWFGFRLSKELTAPIQGLAQGTERIAEGDLSVRLEDRSSDEFSVLVQSFNRMAEDLEQGQARLTEANEQLHARNLELDKRGQYMAAVLDNIAAGVVSLDKQGRITTVNKTAAAVLGAEPAKLLGRRPDELLPEPFRGQTSRIISLLDRMPEGRWEHQFDLTLRGEEKKLLVTIVGLSAPPDDEEGQGAVAVFEDLTELEKMQRMAAWREVARRIAHEIKNPLTPIKLSAQRLERKFADQIQDPAFRLCTSLIVQQVEQLQHMVQEFSAFAKLPEANLALDDPMPLLREVAALFQNSHGHLRFELDLPEDLPMIRMDRDGLSAALLNLLNNAAEAIDGDEPETPSNEGDKPRGRVVIRARSLPQQGVLRIEIQDNGPGLDEAERNRVFEPYFSRKKGGTGLGLTIVKSIVSDHQGYVRVHPAKPRGSVFAIELPL